MSISFVIIFLIGCSEQESNANKVLTNNSSDSTNPVLDAQNMKILQRTIQLFKSIDDISDESKLIECGSILFDEYEKMSSKKDIDSLIYSLEKFKKGATNCNEKLNISLGKVSSLYVDDADSSINSIKSLNIDIYNISIQMHEAFIQSAIKQIDLLNRRGGIKMELINGVRDLVMLEPGANYRDGDKESSEASELMDKGLSLMERRNSMVLGLIESQNSFINQMEVKYNTDLSDYYIK